METGRWGGGSEKKSADEICVTLNAAAAVAVPCTSFDI